MKLFLLHTWTVSAKAKEKIPTAIASRQQWFVRSSSWIIRIGSIQVTHDIDQTLYDLVHAPLAKEYWIQKARIHEETFSTVNWNRLGQALNKMPLSR
jgi:hypothetical protein